MKQPFVQSFMLFVLLSSFILTSCVGQTAVAQQQPVVNTAVESNNTAINEPLLPPASQPSTAVDGSTLLVPESVLAQEQAFINLYDHVSPSVVHIRTGSGQGSGFVFDDAGHIVTNQHVIAGARGIEVTFTDGRVLPATIVGQDATSDLAVLRVDSGQQALVPLSLADSDSLRVGQIVAAIGSPFGLESSMTTGIISALDRSFDGQSSLGSNFQVPDIIQTDAAINPGNSGGPLFDLYGRVIGVNARIESPVRGSSGIGYAIPANIVQAVVPQLIDGGQAQHPWLGISGLEINAATAVQLGLDASLRGVLVSGVSSGSPAAQAGLRPANSNGAGGDLIVGIDDRTVSSFDDLLGYIVSYTAVGQTVQLQILRDGQLQQLPVTLQARPSS